MSTVQSLYNTPRYNTGLHIIVILLSCGSQFFFYNGILFVSLFDLILYVPSTIFQLNRDRSSWVEPVLS